MIDWEEIERGVAAYQKRQLRKMIAKLRSSETEYDAMFLAALKIRRD